MTCQWRNGNIAIIGESAECSAYMCCSDSASLRERERERERDRERADVRMCSRCLVGGCVGVVGTNILGNADEFWGEVLGRQ